MITEHSSNAVAAGSQVDIGSNLTVLLSTRRSGEAPVANGEPMHSREALNGALDRTAGPASASEPRLLLAGMKLADLERLAITQTLQQCCGNRTRAARKLGISVRTLQRKLRIWGNSGSAHRLLPK